MHKSVICVMFCQLVPNFQFTFSGELVLGNSNQANRVEAANKLQPAPPVLSPKEVDDVALQAAGGDRTELAMHRTVQFGKYRGQTFKWLLENAVGWVIYVMRTYEDEGKPTGDNMSINKCLLYEYAHQFPVVVEALKFSRQVQKASKKSLQTGDDGHLLLEFSEFKAMTMGSVYESLQAEHIKFVKFITQKKDIHQGSKMDRFRQYCDRRKAERVSDAELMSIPDSVASTSGINVLCSAA